MRIRSQMSQMSQMGQMSQKTLWVSRTVQVEYLEGVQGLGLRGHIVCPGPHRLGSMINQLYYKL